MSIQINNEVQCMKGSFLPEFWPVVHITADSAE
jgi:hypothetical protein